MKKHLFCRVLSILLACTAAVCLPACQQNAPAAAAGTEATGTTPETMIALNYYPFIIHSGSMYEITDETVSREMIGEKLGEITGNPPNCCTEEEYRRRSSLGYDEREGEASFLAPGTPFYAVNGDYDLIVADLSGQLEVYRREGTTAAARDVLAGYTVKRISLEDHNYYDKRINSDIPVTPLCSAAELEAFLVTAKLHEYYVKEVMDIRKYDSGFFETYALVPVVIVFSPSGSIKYSVGSAVLDGGRLTVEVTETVPECGTCDVASWLLLAEIRRADISAAKSFELAVKTVESARDNR